MSLPSCSLTRKRTITVILGVGFSLLIGGLGVILAVVGLLGKGGKADISSALPNLITGIASITGAIGYLHLKKWAIPVYVVAVIGHSVTHALLFLSHSATGRITPGGIVSLSLVPVLALLVLIDMVRQQKQELS